MNIFAEAIQIAEIVELNNFAETPEAADTVETESVSAETEQSLQINIKINTLGREDFKLTETKKTRPLCNKYYCDRMNLLSSAVIFDINSVFFLCCPDKTSSKTLQYIFAFF